ncbi:hypothetical protein H6F86_16540 [Phormidium sp. FACHB-592]|uniref:Uncharacterized protein n=1 Tax=Stenomitos frigidus AS-A4 TaxID=2933935 RepID=A0ABV0KP80_9CYAN|nr:type IIL restriction-modification enzyme MmeI [Phormidium sp. FACHB-592]MBD2075474.1 hypothetical protein [Phormidium sp. FACHB-592]
MDDAGRQRVQQFLKTWQGSQGNERANYQGFFLDLCDALGVDRPPPKGNIPSDPYAFDKDIRGKSDAGSCRYVGEAGAMGGRARQ